jgi:ribonuclease D
VLLKARSDRSGVAGRLIASAADLDHLAAGGRDVPALAGWRRELFGEDALRLCQGEIGLVVRGDTVTAVPL